MSGRREGKRREWTLWYLQVGSFGLAMLGWVVGLVGSPAVGTGDRTALAVGFALASLGFGAFAAVGYLLSGEARRSAGFGAFGIANALVAIATAASDRVRVFAGAGAAIVLLAAWAVVTSASGSSTGV